jgi:hypothetical protein
LFVQNVIGIIENQRFVRAWGTQRELTKANRMHSKNLQNESHYSSSERMNFVSVIANNKGEIMNVSPLFASLLGVSKVEKIIALHLNILGNTPDEISKAVETLKRQKHCHVAVITLKKADGQLMTCGGDFIALVKEKKEIEYITGTLIFNNGV